MTRITLFVLLLTLACTGPIQNINEPFSLELSAEEAEQYGKSWQSQVQPELAEGFDIELWASDSLAPDPVAMSIDDWGRVYLSSLNRPKNSEFDIRGYRNWMTRSISFQSVEDRRQFLREEFATEKSDSNSWLSDLNGDGFHDWKDLAVEMDEIWRLEDPSGMGMATLGTRILKDFHEEVTDCANALLVRREDIFVGTAPDLWRLEDKNNDGYPDQKQSISHGYGVHIGFGGHGMSGAIEGPDGRIYWGIGDIGANITADGEQYKYPNQGVLVRSNPDGSDFEVVAHGLRNTHEFVFNKFGDIIGADNDGDHQGESERLVHIVEGMDAGWRTNWQFGKYTDPKNNGYNVWMDEKMYVPRWEGQANYIIPPIRNYHNGPTGMIYHPGAALNSAWKDHYFLVEFVGNPARSPIWAFTMTQEGASYQWEQETKILSGILPTAIRFAPDGAIYVADWINGWGTKDYGRVWKLDVNENLDLEQDRQEVKSLMAQDFNTLSLEDLQLHMAHMDMRIRQKAQFALVNKGKEAVPIFENVINGQSDLAGFHAIWGIGQLERTGVLCADVLLPVVQGSNPERIAQAAKVLGDIRYSQAEQELITLVSNDHPRVSFFAIQALGRIKSKNAVEPLINQMIETGDEDLYLRHAITLALARIGEINPIVALKNHEHPAARLGAVLTLRQLSDPRIAEFLTDESEEVVAEAARAINDDWSIVDALPDLANLIQTTKHTSIPLMRRVINANLRLDNLNQVEYLIQYALSAENQSELRSEAIEGAMFWDDPSPLDRVDGRFRGYKERDRNALIQLVKEYANDLLSIADETVLQSVLKMAAVLELNDNLDKIANIQQISRSAQVREEALNTIVSLDAENSKNAITLGMKDKVSSVRANAITFLTKGNFTGAEILELTGPIFQSGSTDEQQQLLNIMSELPAEQVLSTTNDLLDRMRNGTFNRALALEFKDVLKNTNQNDALEEFNELQNTEESIADYAEALYGGNARAGRGYFRWNSEGQCTRCHNIQENTITAGVGPRLQGVGSRLSREQILESLIDPSARIAPGYGAIVLTLTDGEQVSGLLLGEDEEEYRLQGSEAEPLRIPKARVEEAQTLPSSMPAMGQIMSTRELRNMVEFLSSLTEVDS